MPSHHDETQEFTARHQGMVGVVSTGIPVGGYDGPQAEKMRQEKLVGQLKERDPKLFAMAGDVRKEARAGNAKWAEVQTMLAAAVGPDGVRDIIAVLDRDLTEAEKREATVGLQSLAPVRAPEFAYSEDEQRERASKAKAVRK